ncbi:MAG TPA: GspH/FimT family protein [Gemmatimonadales bacterium]|jgi:prepilin-type N-terminal cleavage/methylation domain-containing protein|nr:GspH/FimT family protein [Gemmatimonadales bacterium]
MGRKGFSTIEMIIVVVLIGIIASIGFPRLRRGLEKQRIRNTKALLATMVATARATAIQRGCVATLNFAADSVWVTACGLVGNPPPATVLVGTAKRVKADVNVTLSYTASTIRYDPRGIRLTFQPTTVRVIGPTYQDSVVINELGKVKRQ